MRSPPKEWFFHPSRWRIPLFMTILKVKGSSSEDLPPLAAGCAVAHLPTKKGLKTAEIDALRKFCFAWTFPVVACPLAPNSVPDSLSFRRWTKFSNSGSSRLNLYEPAIPKAVYRICLLPPGPSPLSLFHELLTVRGTLPLGLPRSGRNPSSYVSFLFHSSRTVLAISISFLHPASLISRQF